MWSSPHCPRAPPVTVWEPLCQMIALISPRSLLSLCSLLLLLSTSSPMKMTTMPTSTQEMVTIIFKPSPPPEWSSLTLGAFTNGAMVPVRRSYGLWQIMVLRPQQLHDIIPMRVNGVVVGTFDLCRLMIATPAAFSWPWHLTFAKCRTVLKMQMTSSFKAKCSAWLFSSRSNWRRQLAGLQTCLKRNTNVFYIVQFITGASIPLSYEQKKGFLPLGFKPLLLARLPGLQFLKHKGCVTDSLPAQPSDCQWSYYTTSGAAGESYTSLPLPAGRDRCFSGSVPCE